MKSDIADIVAMNGLQPVDYTFFEVGFDYNGNKYYGCSRCSLRFFFLF
jgi:hypothetical protein